MISENPLLTEICTDAAPDPRQPGEGLSAPLGAVDGWERRQVRRYEGGFALAYRLDGRHPSCRASSLLA
jgi:hypothetical protein